MTAKILKSAIAGIRDFPARAAAHAVEMKNWREHMARVKDDEAKGVTGIEKHWPHPRPDAHPLVEAAVNENCDMDYELVDDGPTPDQVLREMKNRLIETVSQLERTAIEAVAPPGKWRLLNMRENSIIEAQAERMKEVGVVASVATAIGLKKPPGLSEEDAAHISAQNDLRRKIQSIQRSAAQAHSDIEDLTAETIDGWQMPSFE